MTVINGIEIDNIKIIKNEIKEAIINNDPIEDNLHVVIVISNPCQYAKRFILAKQFIKKFDNELNIKLYIVELAYNNQNFYCTDPNNKNHLQLKTSSAPLWHKENMINIGVNKLLPKLDTKFILIVASNDPTFPSGRGDSRCNLYLDCKNIIKTPNINNTSAT